MHDTSPVVAVHTTHCTYTPPMKLWLGLIAEKPRDVLTYLELFYVQATQVGLNRRNLALVVTHWSNQPRHSTPGQLNYQYAMPCDI